MGRVGGRPGRKEFTVGFNSWLFVYVFLYSFKGTVWQKKSSCPLNPDVNKTCGQKLFLLQFSTGDSKRRLLTHTRLQ